MNSYARSSSAVSKLSYRKRRRVIHESSSESDRASESESTPVIRKQKSTRKPPAAKHKGRRRKFNSNQRSDPSPALLNEIVQLGLPQEYHDSLAARAKADRTLASYEKHYSSFDQFCEMINDHRSRIILLDKAPKNSPPVDPDTIVLYCKYKRLPKDTTIRRRNGEPLLDVNSNIVTAAGGWKAPINETQFKSALSMVHKLRGHEEPFKEACVTCIDQYRKNPDTHGCQFHRGRPQLFHSGNSTLSASVRRYFEELSQSTSDYVPHGSKPMTPWQYQKLITYLISTNQSAPFMIAVMVVIAVNLFLREDEVSSLKFEDIIWNLSHLKPDGTLDCICIKIHGKTDKHPTHLILWRNRRCPYLCPVNLLMWWLSASGIRSGYLFPPSEQLQSSASHTNARIAYETFLDIFKKSMKATERRETLDENNDSGSHMDEDEEVHEQKWGSHSCRKTAFMIATFGGANDSDLLQTARLKSVKTIAIYRQDCNTLKGFSESTGKNYSYIIDDYRCQILKHREEARNMLSYRTACTSSAALSAWRRKHPQGNSFAKILDNWIYLSDIQRLTNDFFDRFNSLRSFMISMTSKSAVVKDLTTVEAQLASLTESLATIKVSASGMGLLDPHSGEQLLSQNTDDPLLSTPSSDPSISSPVTNQHSSFDSIVSDLSISSSQQSCVPSTQISQVPKKPKEPAELWITTAELGYCRRCALSSIAIETVAIRT